MAASSSSSMASDHNKSQNEMKQQTTNPEGRIIDGQIDAFKRGKNCHQCRHKPRTSAATCKNHQRKNKPCTLLFCRECLFNRYGEKAEEVGLLEQWICPRCRGDCNCSCCRKKGGQEPTGILCYKAKAAGFSSVSELLHVNGPENFCIYRNAKDTGASPKKLGASKKEIMAAQGTVLDVKPLTAIPYQQSTMEEMNYPSEDKIEEVDVAAEDVTIEDADIPQSLVPENPKSSPRQTTESPVLLLNVPSACISSEIAIPDSAHNIDKNIEEFVDDISDFKDHSHVNDPNAPPSPHQMFPAIFDGTQAIEITDEETFEFARKIGLAESHAAGRKRLTYHTLPESSKKRKATDEEIARVNQQNVGEANKKEIGELVALRNDVDMLTTKITGIDENVAVMRHDVKNISKNVMTQATTSSADLQDLVKKVNHLQQSQDAYRETQLHMLSLLMEIANRLGISVDDVTKGNKKLGGTSCRDEAAEKKDDRLGISVDDVTKGNKKLGGTSCRDEAAEKKDDGDDGGTHGLGLEVTPTHI